MADTHAFPPTDAGGGAPDRAGLDPGMPWRARLRWELRSGGPLLAVAEPSARDRPVAADLARCLAPRRPALLCGGRLALDAVPALRCMFLAAALHATYVDFAVYYPPANWWYYLIYLTHWGHVLNTLYLAASLGVRVLPTAALRRWRVGADPPGAPPPLLARAAWSLYALAAPLALAVALLYWGALVPIAGGVPTNGPTLYRVHFGRFVERYGGWGGPGRGDLLDLRASTYVSVMEHGVVGLLVLVDGARVGAVPVRARQVAVLMGLCAAYLAWSGLHCLLGVGVGDWDGPMWDVATDDDADDDDDAIYPVLNWCGGEEGIKVASYVSMFAVLVLAPGCFWAVWMLGLAAPKEGGKAKGCCGYKYDGSARPVHVVARTQEEAFAYEEHAEVLAVV